ncbi:hypothetical protein [Ruania albidiflava]|uniref:hypothetical protein n=1 Tax=Ruania albidiflava TaxID=366586 RepID=UPI0023F48F65|nr:hypothetical protein [Ruania albidiflava]
MPAVTRLVTVVDIDDRAVSPVSLAGAPSLDGFEPGWAAASQETRPADPRVMSLSALFMAVLDDDRRLTVLDDRGWTESGPPDIWRHTSVESITTQARTVVGPDEPREGHSEEASESDHWEYLAGVLDQQGVQIAAGELQRLPHDVELTERLRNRLSNA